MALKSFATPIGTGDTTVFEMEAGLSGAVALLIGNVSAFARTYAIDHFKASTSATTVLGSGISIAANSVVRFPTALTLEAGDKIIMRASALGSIVVSGAVSARGSAIGSAWTPRGIYSAATTYAENDIVDGGDEQTYLSLQSANLNNPPATSPSFWMAINLRNPLPAQLFDLAAIADVSNITAMADLVGAANKAIVFTGPGTMALITWSAHGQAMAAAADAGATKVILSLGNVTNTSDANKPVSTAQLTALDLKVATALLGAVSGVAQLDAGGKVPTAQLPASQIDNDAVTNVKLANMAAATVKMRELGAGTGDPIDGTMAQLKTSMALAIATVANRLPKYGDTTGGQVESGASIATGDVLTMPGGVKSLSFSLTDDTATSFTIPNQCVLLIFGTTSAVNTNPRHLIFARGVAAVNADFLQIGSAATLVDVTTGALTGMDGVDTHYTISIHTDNKCYLENRSGGVRAVTVFIIPQ